MVPLIDIADHAVEPTCRVVDAGFDFELVANSDLPAESEVTISYGPFSNEELFIDYGFTLDNNPHDKFAVNCDAVMIDTARVVMGLSNAFGDSISLGKRNQSRLVSIGSGSDRFQDRRLAAWQVEWLRVLNIYGPSANTVMQMRGKDISGVDPRLWALLRIIYARQEEDLTRHGYDPFTIQAMGSFVSLDIEVAVLKTIVGILAVMLRSFGTDLTNDYYCIKNNLFDAEAENRAMSSASNDILADVSRTVRMALGVKEPQPQSLTVRRAQETLAAAQNKKTSSNIYEGNSPFTNVNVTLEKSLEDIIKSQLFGPISEKSKPVDVEAIAVSPQENSPNLPSRRTSEDPECLDSLGMELSVSIREALKYRIRKKQVISDLIKNAGQLHKVIVSNLHRFFTSPAIETAR